MLNAMPAGWPALKMVTLRLQNQLHTLAAASLVEGDATLVGRQEAQAAGLHAELLLQHWQLVA